MNRLGMVGLPLKPYVSTSHVSTNFVSASWMTRSAKAARLEHDMAQHGPTLGQEGSCFSDSTPSPQCQLLGWAIAQPCVPGISAVLAARPPAFEAS